MALIKAQHAPPSLQPFSMKDVEDAAKRVLLRARMQAEQLLVAAQKEAEALKEMARVEGMAEGLQEGHAKGLAQGLEAGRTQALGEHQQQLTQTVQALASIVVDLDARRQDLEAEALREVVQLAASIARRVTKRQGMIDESVLTANLVECMRMVVYKADVRIAIHPDQRKTMETALPQLKLEWPSLQHVELIDDATLAPGGCRIHTRQGIVDADLDHQLDRVIEDLLPRS